MWAYLLGGWWPAQQPDVSAAAPPPAVVEGVEDVKPVTVSVLSDSHAFNADSWFRQTVAAGAVEGAVLGEFSSYPGADLARIGKHRREVARSDWVIVQGGTNDLLAARDPEQVATDLRALVADVAASGPQVVVALVPPSEARAAETVRLNALIGDWAASDGVPVLDLYSPVGTEDGTWRDGMTGDGVHASQRGADRMADAADRQLDQVVG